MYVRLWLLYTNYSITNLHVTQCVWSRLLLWSEREVNFHTLALQHSILKFWWSTHCCLFDSIGNRFVSLYMCYHKTKYLTRNTINWLLVWILNSSQIGQRLESIEITDLEQSPGDPLYQVLHHDTPTLLSYYSRKSLIWTSVIQTCMSNNWTPLYLVKVYCNDHKNY